MLICADPATEPSLKTIADELGAETAVRFESDVYVVQPMDNDVEASALRQRFAAAEASLDYHLPTPGVTSSHADTEHRDG